MTKISFPRCFLRTLALALPLALAGNVHADESSVKSGVEAYIGAGIQSLGAISVDSVRRISQGGLYEVMLSTGDLIYTDDAVSFIIDGHIIDTRTRSDVTAVRLEQLSIIDFAALPLDHAVKRVNGNGKRVIATFEDPNCSFCKRLGQELLKVKDVTLYTFLYPILSPDSETKSRNIWCAEDRAQSWNDWLIKNRTPGTAQCDSSVIDRNTELGRKLRINSTPTLFFADGSRINGFRDAAILEQKLAEIPKEQQEAGDKNQETAK
ncbi:MAG: DsbC family protein [Azoarcus sp.]|jgi:thiol:disulfide interchange protein DsbC|nr:DsbC family protein [Azoarcus sp.]